MIRAGGPRRARGTWRAPWTVMPYATNSQLPERIRSCLPTHAQDIFRAAFNAAYARYGPGNEARAFRIAWAAVKRSYVHPRARIWISRARAEHTIPLRRRPVGVHGVRKH